MRSRRFRNTLTKHNIRTITLLLALVLIIAAATGGVTVAYLVISSNSVVNTFVPGTITGKITEEFDDTSKTSAKVTNHGDIDAYTRVAIVGVETNADGQVIGSYDVSSFIDTDKWDLVNGYYYYKGVLAPGASSEDLLKKDIPLRVTDTSGEEAVTHYYQVTIVAELIQAEGTTSAGTAAVTDAWGVSYSSGFTAGGTWSAVSGN